MVERLFSTPRILGIWSLERWIQLGPAVLMEIYSPDVMAVKAGAKVEILGCILKPMFNGRGAGFVRSQMASMSSLSKCAIIRGYVPVNRGRLN